MLQRSDEWFEERAKRFTASCASELLSNGRAKDSFGLDFYSLCFKVAVGRVFGYDSEWNVSTWDMKRGTDTEPEAFEVLKQIMAREFLVLEECSFFPYGENAGASPDGIVVGKPIIAEIKCPRPDVVFKLISDGIIDPKHYKQIQMQLLCTNSDICYYFNYAIWKGDLIYHLIKVYRNAEMISEIKLRLEFGEPIVQEHVEKLMKNKQF